LADKGLAAALEAQARKATVPTSVAADGVGRYSPEVEAAIYFCALEALNNVAKYAEASRASIRLARAEDAVSFEVTDDGRGFDVADASAGTGLRGMRDRLDAIGGSLDVRSAPGGGTTVTGWIPTAAHPHEGATA
jgi:signal transduction histidine kinase